MRLASIEDDAKAFLDMDAVGSCALIPEADTESAIAINTAGEVEGAGEAEIAETRRDIGIMGPWVEEEEGGGRQDSDEA